MNSTNNRDIDRIIRQLAISMIEAKEDPAGVGVVFLLGAGCSMQYGGPGFVALLQRLWRRLVDRQADPPLDLAQLRSDIDPSWRRQDAPHRREAVRSCLPHIQGSSCIAYVRLAKLFNDGFVRAVLNMNFDGLFEDAARAVGLATRAHEGDRTDDPTGNGSVARRLLRIHGGVGEGEAPVLETGESEYFKGDCLRQMVVDLCQKNHVVMVGYSGVDSKIGEAVRLSRSDTQMNMVRIVPQLFWINPAPPDSRIRPALPARLSNELVLCGAAAGFEEFMERLSHDIARQAAETREDVHRPGARWTAPSSAAESLRASPAEDEAVSQCRRFARYLRSTMGVVEQGPETRSLDFSALRRWDLEAHADQLTDKALALAERARVPLTPVERFVVRAVACFHDLGFLDGRRGDRAGLVGGFDLLQSHGTLTRSLIERWFYNPSIRDPLVPATFKVEAERTGVIELILELCEHHEHRDRAPDTAEDTASTVKSVHIDGYPIAVRVALLQAVVKAAEALCGVHEFGTRPRSVPPQLAARLSAIEDPVLELMSMAAGLDPSFLVEDGVVTAKPPSEHSALAKWALHRAERAVNDLNSTARAIDDRAGIRWESRLDHPGDRGSGGYRRLLGSALEERLERLSDEVTAGVPGEAAMLLDLVALFAMPLAGDQQSREPRVSLDAGIVTGIFGRIDDCEGPVGSKTLLRYLRLKRAPGPLTPLGQAFVCSYERRLYPGWRYCARTLHLGVESLSMSGAVLDYGSTGFRAESVAAALAVNHALERRLDGTVAVGHSWCMLCTARILYCLLTLRERFLPTELNALLPMIGETAGKVLDGLLSPFQKRGEETIADYFGTPDQRDDPRRRVESPRYAAWVLRSLGLLLDREPALARSRGGWMSDAQMNTSRRLYDALWHRLAVLTVESLERMQDEEPTEVSFGDLALVAAECRARGQAVDTPPAVAEGVRRMVKQREDGLRAIPQLSQCYLLPALVELAGDDARFPQEEVIRAVAAISNSFIWIQSEPHGRGFGSWGYNIVNTRRILSALHHYWEAVFDREGEFSRAFEAIGNELSET